MNEYQEYHRRQTLSLRVRGGLGDRRDRGEMTLHTNTIRTQEKFHFQTHRGTFNQWGAVGWPEPYRMMDRRRQREGTQSRVGSRN
jgi:hypothetical protein